jgi:phage-related minor tail protein
MKDFVEEVRVMTLHGSSVQYIASVCDMPVEQVEAAIDLLMEDDDFRATVGDDVDEEWDFSDDSMDGDFDSAMESAGYGTDEDYGADFTDGEFI